jgi:hypothetical protein
VKELQDKVAALEASFMKATEDKNVAIAQVRLCFHVCVLDLLWHGMAALHLQACTSHGSSVCVHVLHAHTNRLRRPRARRSSPTGWSTACRARTSAGARPSRRWRPPAAGWCARRFWCAAVRHPALPRGGRACC